MACDICADTGTVPDRDKLAPCPACEAGVRIPPPDPPEPPEEGAEEAEAA